MCIYIYMSFIELSKEIDYNLGCIYNMLKIFGNPLTLMVEVVPEKRVHQLMKTDQAQRSVVISISPFFGGLKIDSRDSVAIGVCSLFFVSVEATKRIKIENETKTNYKQQSISTYLRGQIFQIWQLSMFSHSQFNHLKQILLLVDRMSQSIVLTLTSDLSNFSFTFLQFDLAMTLLLFSFFPSSRSFYFVWSSFYFLKRLTFVWLPRNKKTMVVRNLSCSVVSLQPSKL